MGLTHAQTRRGKAGAAAQKRSVILSAAQISSRNDGDVREDDFSRRAT
jgi:hypothetical protein